MFRDRHEISLSQHQLKSFDGWARPAVALRCAADGSETDDEPTMQAKNSIDLVQDATNDCSVVASLCALTTRSEKGHTLVQSS